MCPNEAKEIQDSKKKIQKKSALLISVCVYVCLRDERTVDGRKFEQRTEKKESDDYKIKRK